MKKLLLAAFFFLNGVCLYACEETYASLEEEARAKGILSGNSLPTQEFVLEEKIDDNNNAYPCFRVCKCCTVPDLSLACVEAEIARLTKIYPSLAPDAPYTEEDTSTAEWRMCACPGLIPFEDDHSCKILEMDRLKHFYPKFPYECPLIITDAATEMQSKIPYSYMRPPEPRTLNLILKKVRGEACTPEELQRVQSFLENSPKIPME